MTKKQLIVLVLLLVSALVPILSGGGKKNKSKPVNSGSLSESHSQEMNEARTGLTNDPELFAKADQTLTKLTSLKELGTVPGPKLKSADDLLKETQFLMPSEETQTPAPTAAPDVIAELELTPKATPIPTAAPTDAPAEEFPPIPEVTKTPGISRESVIENEKLQLKIASLEAKLDEQKRNFESRVSDLKSKLDVQESENVKLSHQIQNAENNSADATKLQAKIKDLDLRLTKAKSDLVDERKRSEDGKTLGMEYSKRLNEEQKFRKSIEDQLEVAIRKRDEQAKDNEKLRRVVGDFEKRVRLIEEQRLALSEDKEQVLLKQLGSLRKELTSTQAALDELKKRQKAQNAEVNAAGSKLEALHDQLAEKQKENDELSVKLATAERLNERSKGLQQELLDARNELMLAQEQVRTMISTSKNPSIEYQNRNFQRPETIQPTRTERPVVAVQPTSAPVPSDYLTVEVTTQKAALRAGPGEENSIVMEIQQGSRLMVETKEGDWYRVVTPKGQRAYIRSDLAVELDGSGRQRYPNAAQRTPRPTRTLNPNPPDSYPLVELLGRQLKERKNVQQPDDSLNADEPTPTPAPTASGNVEDEMEAFENLKKGMKKEGVSD